MTLPTFEDFILEWMVLNDMNPGMRSGQTAFLALVDIRDRTVPEGLGIVRLSTLVIHKEVDPYYDDARLDDFLHLVKEHWDSYEFSPS